jgi:hypothetical protein
MWFVPDGMDISPLEYADNARFLARLPCSGQRPRNGPTAGCCKEMAPPHLPSALAR